MTTLYTHISLHELLLAMALSMCWHFSFNKNTVDKALKFIPQFAPMLDDRHPVDCIPLHTVHSTGDCEDWSSSVPPDKKLLFHSCGYDKENSKLIDIAVHMSSYTLLNCEAQPLCSINLWI